MKQTNLRIKSALVLTAAIVAGVAGLVLAPYASAGSAAQITVEPLASQVDYTNGTFSVQVKIAGLDHQGGIEYDDNRDTVPDRIEPSIGMAAYEVTLLFDPGVIAVSDVDAGDFISSSGRSGQCFERVAEDGRHAVACVSVGSQTGAQGDGLLATFTLEPLANGMTFLAIEAGLSGPLGDPISISVTGGVVEVFGAPAEAPTPGPDDPDDPNDPGTGPTVIGPGDLGDITPPVGDPLTDTNGDTVINNEDLPSAGTGFDPVEATWPLTITGALVALGAALFLLSTRFSATPRRE